MKRNLSVENQRKLAKITPASIFIERTFCVINKCCAILKPRRLALLWMILLSTTAFGSWSGNLGYNNPPGAYGINFLYLGQTIGFEGGIGSLQAAAKTDETSSTGNGSNSSLSLSGALNLKYFFSKGTLNPYVLVGTGTTIAVGKAAATAGVSGGFLGGGVLVGSEKFYMYGGVVGGRSLWPQAGLGIGF